MQRRLAPEIRLEVAGGIEVRVAHKLPGPAMKLVGAVAGDDVDGGAARAAVLRAHVVSYHLKLSHGVRRQLHHLVRESLVRGAIEVVVQAVQHVVIKDAAQAVDIERSLALTVTFTLLAGAGNDA